MVKPPPPSPLLYRPTTTTTTTTTTAAAATANNKKILRRALLVALSVGLPLMQLRVASYGGGDGRRRDPLASQEGGGGLASFLATALLSLDPPPSPPPPSMSVAPAAAAAAAAAPAAEASGSGPSLGARGAVAAAEREAEEERRRPAVGDGNGDPRGDVRGGREGASNEVQWLDRGAFPDVRDFFSASWLMGMDNFLRTNVSAANMGNVEAGCFGAFRGRTDRLLMSLDWLDFSVEHMSKWWRVLNCPHDPTALNLTVNVLTSYVARTTNGAAETPPAAFHHGNEGSPLRPTIALIAFQPFRSNRYDKDGDLEPKYRALTVASLAATISSLLRIGVGRVVVVGYGVVDEPVVRDAFHILDPASCGANGEGGKGDGHVCAVRGTELAFARVTDDMVKTQHSKVNLPRAALAGLMRAKQDQLGGEDDEEWRRTWLGPNPERWRYVYLTEPDTLLHTRPSTLEHIKTKLDEGHIVVPHRLQPIPHEADAGHLGVPNLVTTNFKAPIVLRSVGGDPQRQPQHACCDAQEGRYRPGRNPDVDDGCRQPFFWWQCGYYKTSGNHTRLDKYGLIRLSDGTGVVTLAGNEQGRRCVPNKVGRCEVKTRSD